MTSRVPTLVTPLALLIAAGLLVGCSSPADSGGDTGTEPDTSSESSAPDDSGTAVNFGGGKALPMGSMQLPGSADSGDVSGRHPKISASFARFSSS